MFWVSWDFDGMNEDWVGSGRGLFLGLSSWAFCGGCLFPRGHGVFPFPFLFLLFYVIGGLGVLSHGTVLGFFFFYFSYFFSVDIGTFLNTEHDPALLHMSTYIAKTCHRAH